MARSSGGANHSRPSISDPKSSLSLQDVQRVAQRLAVIYNAEQLLSAIGYIGPQDKLKGRELLIFARRKRKLTATREVFAHM